MRRAVRILSMLLVLGSAACTYYTPLQIASENRPGSVAQSNGRMVEGRSCQHFLLGFQLNSGNTVRAALDQAKSNAGTPALTDLTVDVARTRGLLWSRNCTIVHGLPAQP